VSQIKEVFHEDTNMANVSIAVKFGEATKIWKISMPLITYPFPSV
jgi:hypothetical protein